MSPVIKLSKHQSGAALLIALAITVLAAVLALRAIELGEVDLRRSSLLIRSDQARQLSLGLEDWAISLIQRDQEHSRGAKFDGLQDIWYQRLPETPVPGGSISGQLIDLDGRFNINSLLDIDGSVDNLALERFRRLLRTLQLNPAIADQALDWLDSDNMPQAQGAEDSSYQARANPGLAANQRLSHISELRLLPAMSNAAWNKLQVFVQASPTRGSSVNINTASAEVLMSLADGVSRQMANSLIRLRGAGFESMPKFLRQSLFESIRIDPRGLSVRSKVYRATAEIIMDQETTRIETLLLRRGSVYHVLSRRRINL